MKADLGAQMVRRERHRALVLGGACLASLLTLAAISLYPATKKSGTQQRRLEELEDLIEVQGLLRPLFVDLKKAKMRMILPEGLSYVQPVSLERKHLLDFDDEINALAAMCGVNVATMEVQAGAIERTDRILVNAVFIGDFSEFKQLLLGMGQLPWIHAFHQLEVAGYVDQEQLSVQFELAVD